MLVWCPWETCISLKGLFLLHAPSLDQFSLESFLVEKSIQFKSLYLVGVTSFPLYFEEFFENLQVFSLPQILYWHAATRAPLPLSLFLLVL